MEPILKPQLLIICGPTATGKTGLALKLAQRFSAQLISADSRQVYQGMDIGTGKDLPPRAKKHSSGCYLVNGVKLWGYDLVKPDQAFSLAHFVNFARPLINQIHSQHQLPILVGGTGLYLKGITQSLSTISIPPSPRLRAKLTNQSVTQLQRTLLQLHPQRFQAMNHSDQHNPRRLIRAIEIAPASPSGSTHSTSSPGFDSLWLGLKAPLKSLDQRLIARVDQRLQAGAQQEVASLLKQGYSWDLPALSAMGYRQWRPFFTKQADLASVRQAWILAEKQYLRRQLTWFKAQPQIHWFDISRSYWSQVVKLTNNWYTETYGHSKD